MFYAQAHGYGMRRGQPIIYLFFLFFSNSRVYHIVSYARFSSKPIQMQKKTAKMAFDFDCMAMI